MKTHQLINQDSGNVEYYTPPFIIEAARRVLGEIDLDPASCEIANKTVKAARIYTREDDGLAQEWTGRVWMNHPFSRAETACDPVVTGKPCVKKKCKDRGYHAITDLAGNSAWINKLLNSHVFGSVEKALCITFASTSEAWFQPLLEWPQCFLSPRTNYVDANGEVVRGVSKGSVVTYLGEGIEGFRAAFKGMGVIK